MSSPSTDHKKMLPRKKDLRWWKLSRHLELRDSADDEDGEKIVRYKRVLGEHRRRTADRRRDDEEKTAMSM